MKKITVFIAFLLLVTSCANQSTSRDESANNPLSGNFSSHDEKSEILWRNMNLFAEADFSYVEELLPESFTLKSAGDVNVVANGPSEAIEYWNGLHSIFENITFDSEGRLMTFNLNNGEVWSAYFGTCYADGKFSKNKIAFPLHVWIQWDGDKIIHQVDMLDSKFITDELNASTIE